MRQLIMVQDRIHTDRFYLRQEFLAQVHRPRRATVTVAVSQVQDRDPLEYSGSHIHILDRIGLVEAAWQCHPIVRDVNEAVSQPDDVLDAHRKAVP